jgi:uncharacterized protein
VNLPDYQPTLATEPLSEAELDQLDALLQALPADGAMTVECLDGYLCALLLGPALPPSAQWMPAIWGADTLPDAASNDPNTAPFASGKQQKRCVQFVLRMLADVHRRLQADPDQFEPVFSIAEHEGEEWVDAEIWCLGFLQGTALQAAYWDPLFEDPTQGPLLAPIPLLAALPEELDEVDRSLVAQPEQRDALSRQVAEAIGALWHLRHG